MWHLSNFQDNRLITLKRKLTLNMIQNICSDKSRRLNSSWAWNVRTSESIHWKSRNTVWSWHISSFNKNQIWASANVKPWGSWNEADSRWNSTVYHTSYVGNLNTPPPTFWHNAINLMLTDGICLFEKVIAKSTIFR